MSRQKVFMTLTIALLGFALGVGCTVTAQKYEIPGFIAADDYRHRHGPVLSIGEFTVNLKGDAYLKTAISIEGVSSKSAGIIKAKDVMIKDRVNTVLANKSLAEVATVQAREKLREELLSQLNQVADMQIHNVYFLSFIYQ